MVSPGKNPVTIMLAGGGNEIISPARGDLLNSHQVECNDFIATANELFLAAKDCLNDDWPGKSVVGNEVKNHGYR